METYRKLPSVGIHPGAYKAAMECGKQIGTVFSDSSELETALNSVTPGGGNTLLHLAASVRNIECIRELLKCKPLLVSQTNSQGNTALHLAAQRGFSDVVELILKENESGVDAANDLGETALFKACESGDSKTVEQLLKALWASLYKRTKDNRTCLNVAINRGDSDVVKHILQSYREDSAEIISETYNHGDTALHVAVGRNYLHIITQLIEFEPQLCYCLNDNHETPLLMAAKLGHLEAVKELIKWRPDAVEIPNSYGMNALHLAAQVSQLRIVDYLNETVFLLDLVNKGLEEPPEEKPMQSEENAVPAKKKDPFSKISKGDTPLHIAARNKCFHMVDSLLRIPGINKAAVNKEGLTALDIAREITEYHESHKIIAMLSSYPSKCRPFLYSAPKVTAEKQKAAIKLLDETFDARRNTELVVAVLLATMSFTAAFTVPGGFQTEREKVKTEKMLGSPVLIGFESFKVFLIFDCLAFFLSLFALLVWQMSTPLTTENKVVFLCFTNLSLCATFAFTAYGFMAALYTMLAHKVNLLAWVALGTCTFICCCGNLAFFYLSARFLLKMARFNVLRGVCPFMSDRLVEYVWIKLESWGICDLLRKYKSKIVDIFYLNCLRKARLMPNSAEESKLCCFISYCNPLIKDMPKHERSAENRSGETCFC